MTTRALTLNLPEPLFQYLQQVARMTRQPLERVVAQSIAGNLPPTVVNAPAEVQQDLAAMQQLDVADLRAVLEAQVPGPRQARHMALLDQNAEGRITLEEQDELATLRRDADVLMLRKAYAAAVLRWLGDAVTNVPAE